VPPEGTRPEGHIPASSTRNSAPPLTLSSTQTLPGAQEAQTPASPETVCASLEPPPSGAVASDPEELDDPVEPEEPEEPEDPEPPELEPEPDPEPPDSLPPSSPDWPLLDDDEQDEAQKMTDKSETAARAFMTPPLT
jgi:hypothetical protein